MKILKLTSTVLLLLLVFDYKQWEAWLDSNKISWVNWSAFDKPVELCSILYPGASSSEVGHHPAYQDR